MCALLSLEFIFLVTYLFTACKCQDQLSFCEYTIVDEDLNFDYHRLFKDALYRNEENNSISSKVAFSSIQDPSLPAFQSHTSYCVQIKISLALALIIAIGHSFGHHSILKIRP